MSDFFAIPPADAFWLVLWAGCAIWAATAGADLGAGMWSFFASGPRARAQSEAALFAIAPVWEANHVWLVFGVALLLAAFPKALAAFGTALHIPLTLAAFALVLRGSAFGLQGHGRPGTLARERWIAIFGVSSLLSSVFLGLAVGALPTGEIALADGKVVSGQFAGWTAPLAGFAGLFAAALCAFVSAVGLAARTKGELREDFRRLAAGAQTVVAALAALAVCLPGVMTGEFRRGLLSPERALPALAAAAFLGTGALGLLAVGRFRAARFAAGAEAASFVTAWALALDRHFLFPGLAVSESGFREELGPAIGLAIAYGLAVLIPALALLYRAFGRNPETPSGV